MILFYRIRILERIMDTWILIYQFYLPSTGQRMFYSHFQLENQPEISGLHFYYDCACSKQLQCLGSWSATFWLPGSRSAKICGSVDSVPRAKFQPKLYIYLSKLDIYLSKLDVYLSKLDIYHSKLDIYLSKHRSQLLTTKEINKNFLISK